ncbi:MAG: GNAT family N-acetyltransferase [Burkholderiales bacterium]|nr:GNAT family N-acetyltransferase [Burkholderiales bacterium]
MTTPPAFIVRPAGWHLSHRALHAVRRTVFIKEQNVPEAEEWDDNDEHSRHVLALTVYGEPIGTGRLLPDGHIGRMAVLREWRGMGVGSTILSTLLELARQDGLRTIRLNAQTHALDFYARHGFTIVGDEFMEAGIPHREMQIRLNP